MSAAATRTSARADLGILDALRGLAAVYVVIYHARVLLWAGYAAYIPQGTQSPSVWIGYAQYVSALPAGPEWALRNLSMLLNFGIEAVVLFFILSGFCIHYRQAAALAVGRSATEGALDLRAYAFRRFRRLYPPLIAGLAVTAVFDAIGAGLNADVYAARTQYGLLNTNLEGGDHYAPGTVVANLLMQGGLVAPPFGSNGVVWSLAFEFWYYGLYPVLFLIASRWGAARMFHLALAVSLLGLSLRLVGVIPSRVALLLSCWSIWAAGAAIAEAYVGRIRIGHAGSLALGAGATLTALVVLPLARPDVATAISAGNALGALLWGAALTPLVAYLMVGSHGGLRQLVESAARRLGGLGSISYSLYLVHYPLMLLLSAWWLASHAALPDGPELAMVGIMLALALGSGSWYLVERRFVSARSGRTKTSVESALVPVRVKASG